MSDPKEDARDAFFAGLAAIQAGDLETAEAKFRHSLALVPGRVSVATNLAGVLFGLGRLDEAAEAAASATHLDPEAAEAWLILARARRLQRRPDEALSAMERVNALRPGDAEAWAGRGAMLAERFRFAEAAEACDRAIALRPDLPDVPGDRLHARMRVADWRDFAEQRTAIADGLRHGVATSRPGPLLSALDDPALQLASARMATPAAPGAAPPGPYRHRRIRVAYLSPDFRDHPVVYLAAGLFEHHDRTRFETIAISTGSSDGSALRRRVAAAFGTFVDADGWSDADIAARIRQAEVDILVDLAGHTAGGRPAVLAARAAPVQVNYLGYPGTSGDGAVDYIVGDAFLIPPGSEGAYREQVVRLPDTFQANDNRRAEPGPPPSREAEGLPPAGFVFCCFNNTYKLNPDMFDVWARLLQAVPGSVLWIVADGEAARASLRAEATARGVDAGRIVFTRRVTYAEHMARLRLADLFLDTLPFNGGTTASDALWAGLPVVTCAGKTFAARMAGSVLRAIGLPQLVTHSIADYESRALHLATTPEALVHVRERLRQNRATSPLFDTARFTRHMEAAYWMMWERAEAGMPPAAFDVRPLSR